MKKLLAASAILLVILSPCVFISRAQSNYADSDARNMVDTRGFRQGYWIITAGLQKLGPPWVPDQVVSEGNYVDSKPEGVWVTYHQNGHKAAEVEYKKGRRNGVCKYFSRAGAITSSSTYVNGKRDGLMTTYYPTGTVWMEYHWSQGEIIGNMKTYYPSGKLYEDGFWANGWFVGDYKIYNENGTLKREVLPPITQ